MKLDARAKNQPRLSIEEVKEIVSHISLGPVLYDHPTFRVMECGDGFLLQLVYLEVDCDAPGDEWKTEQHARKWYVSAHSTHTEVIRTAYKAVQTSLEHRLGEWFTYKGQRVCSPHRSLDVEEPVSPLPPNCS